MKHGCSSARIAFSMYSTLPMGQTEWDEANMKYVFCFFPLVGVVIGALVLLWHHICAHFFLSPALFSGVAVMLPIVVTGGIHADGFLDTVDALHSYADREKKLDILKDPHVGAFGVIMCVLYFLLQFGVWQQFFLTPRFLLFMVTAFTMSRVLCAFCVVSFAPAKRSGLAFLFSSGASKSVVLVCLLVYFALLAFGWVWVNPVLAIVGLLGLVLLVLICKKVIDKAFGGITGDSIGFILQVTELLIMGVAAIGGRFLI